MTMMNDSVKCFESLEIGSRGCFDASIVIRNETIVLVDVPNDGLDIHYDDEINMTILVDFDLFLYSSPQ